MDNYQDKPCEICGKQHNHTYGSGRFCSRKCAGAFRKIKDISPKLKEYLKSRRAPYGKWKCKICNKICNTVYELKIHRISHFSLSNQQIYESQHVIKQIEKYICTYCKKEFDSLKAASGHMTSCKLHPLKELHDLAHKKAGKTQKIKYANSEYRKIHKGFIKGSHHTLETKQKISEKRAEQVRNEYLNKVHAKVKWYKVKNIKGEEFSVRGHWEENVALQLNKLGIYWINLNH